MSKKIRYRSGLERIVHNEYMRKAVYEPFKIDYVQPSKDRVYMPDLVYPNDPNNVYEVKGFPRDKNSLEKSLHVRESNPEINIRFILAKKNSRAYPGVKMFLNDWLDKYEFEWCFYKEIPKSWRS